MATLRQEVLEKYASYVRQLGVRAKVSGKKKYASKGRQFGFSGKICLDQDFMEKFKKKKRFPWKICIKPQKKIKQFGIEPRFCAKIIHKPIISGKCSLKLKHFGVQLRFSRTLGPPNN